VTDSSARTLGIDPGTAIMGYGVVEERGGALHCVQYGVLTTTSAESPAHRLRSLHQRLTELLALYRPGAVAVEDLFFNRNVRTALAVGQARGIALLAAAQAEVPVFEYTPLQVKDAVVGYGRATKEQVQLMIRTLLGLQDVPRPDDAADALAVAICHLHSARLGSLSGRIAR
jgi:crossover junction endodeoxyribonuclease RuvC